MKNYTYHLGTWSGRTPIADFLASLCFYNQHAPYHKTTGDPRRRLQFVHLVLLSTKYQLFVFLFSLHLQRPHLLPTRPSVDSVLHSVLDSVLESVLDSVLESVPLHQHPWCSVVSWAMYMTWLLNPSSAFL